MQRFNVHPQTPQLRLIKQISDRLGSGDIGAVPTDSCYALVTTLGHYEGMERIRKIRGLDDRHLFTVLCADLANVSQYAKVGNVAYRMLKQCLPGPYTFIFKATRQMPRRLMHEKRKEVGLRVPDHRVLQSILSELDEPLVSVSLIPQYESQPLMHADDILEKLAGQLDFVVDAEPCSAEETTVINVANDVPEIIRQGKGDSAFLE